MLYIYSLLKMILGNTQNFEESAANLDFFVPDELTRQPQLNQVFKAPDTLTADWKPTSTVIVKDPPTEVSADL